MKFRSIKTWLALIIMIIPLLFLQHCKKEKSDPKKDIPGKDIPQKDAPGKGPPPLESPPPPGEEQYVPGDIDQILSSMKLGNIAFNVPENMNIDEAKQVQLLLSLQDPIEELKKSLQDEGKKYGASIQVGSRMEARLKGQKFTITAITPEVQAVSESSQTEWKWEVQPKETGNHRLHLTLSALLEIDGQSTPRMVKTFDKEIEVHITAGQRVQSFFSKNWQWLFTGLLAPVIVWLFRYNRIRKLKQKREEGK